MSFSHTNIDVDSEDFEDAERGRLELLEDFESPPSSIVELPQLAQKQKLRASTIKNESDIQKKLVFDMKHKMGIKNVKELDNKLFLDIPQKQHKEELRQKEKENVSEEFSSEEEEKEEVNKLSATSLEPEPKERQSIFRFFGRSKTPPKQYQLQKSNHPDSFCSVPITWHNQGLRYFQTFSCLYLTVCIFLAPYQYFFKESRAIFYACTVADMVYMLVMLFRSRTTHNTDGIEERNLMTVRSGYQSSFAFAMDLITFLPLAQQQLPFIEFNDSLYLLNRQTIVIRLHYIIYYLRAREEESGASTLTYRSAKYILLSCLVVHFAACGWYGLACSRNELDEFSLQQCSGTSWIVFLPQSIIQKVLRETNGTDPSSITLVSFLDNTYVTSLYWSATTVTSTGYGDVRAYTVSEKIFAIISMLVGLGVLYGMTMGGMTSMLTNIDARRATFVHRYRAFENAVNRMGVSKEIKDLCLNYFDYIWRRWEGEDVFSSGFLKSLPATHQSSFASARFKDFFEQADLFSTTEDAFIRNLALYAKPTFYLKNQFVQKSGEICERMCYLHAGLLEVLDDNEEEVLALMHPGKLLGQSMLFFDFPRIHSVRCKTNCDIFTLSKQDFRNTLALYPNSAIKLLQAVEKKCSPPGMLWPLTPVSEGELVSYLDQTYNAKQLKLRVAENLGPQKVKYLTGRAIHRLRTVYFKDYSGISLSRVPLYPATQLQPDTKDILEKPPPLVEFLNTETRGKSKVEEGSFRERLFGLTVVNPEGAFYRFWLDSMFFVSLIAGLYTTYIAFFTTVPGEQRLYTYRGDDDLFGSVILEMAAGTCNQTETNLYFTCPPWPFNETVECIRRIGGSFAWRVLGNSSFGYQIREPARYDLSMAVYSLSSERSRILYLLSILFIDVPCVLNILIHFRVGVMTSQGLATSFKDIAGNYIKSNAFLLDVIGLFPFYLLLAGYVGCSRSVYYHEIAFWKLNRVVYYFRYVPSTFARWEYRLKVNITRIRTFKFMVYIYSITHMCACIFYFWSCGYLTQSNVENIIYKCRFGTWAWVFEISYETTSFQDYVKTMYWASTTMTSTGFGDITASTTLGRIFALLTEIVGTVMYGWLVAVIASTISNNDAFIVTFRNSMLDTRRYLSVHEVPNSLIRRVMNVRQLEWEQYKGTAIPGEKMIGRELPDLLQTTLAYENINKFIHCVPFFHGADPSFVSTLCKYALIYHYAEGEVVLYEGDLSRDLYIIKRGHCNVVTSDLETKLEHLSPGDYFGECEMLFGCGSPRTIACGTACEIVLLKRQSLEKALESFPILQQQIYKIQRDEKYKDRILQAIRIKNVGYTEKEKGNMVQKFKMESIDGEHRIYTKRLKNASGFIFLPQNERRIRVNFFGRMLQFFLLPVAFDPLAKTFVFYEFLRTILVLLTLVIVPFQFAFLPAYQPLILLQYLLDLLCLLDQYIKAHTSYFNPRAVLVTHPLRTAYHYIRTSFLVDFLSWFPFEAFVYLRYTGDVIEQQWRLLAILRITRLLQLYKVHGFFSFLLSKIREINQWIIYFRNILYGALLHHWIACILFVLACPPITSNEETFFVQTLLITPLTASGLKTYCQNDTWVGQIVISNSFPALDIINSISDQYIVCLYWATAILVSVGYGDIYANTIVEMLITACIMISGTVFYSFILGGMSASVQTDDSRRGSYREKIADIKKFFKVYDVSQYTEDQVLNYYYYLWDRTGGVSPDKLFIGLPPSVRTSICQCMYGTMIRKAFGDEDKSDKAFQGFYRLLSTYISPYLYLKNSIICRRSDIGNEMFFIQRGTVGVLDDNDRAVIKILGPGQHFGEVALLFTVPRSRTVKALTNCELNVLSKAALDNVLEHFPQFKDKLVTVAETRREAGAALQAKGPVKKTALKLSSKGGGKNQNKTTVEAIWFHFYILARCVPLFAISLIMKVVLGRPYLSRHAQRRRRIIDRDSKFLLVWNHILILLGFSSACLCVYQVCFFNHHVMIYFINYFIDALFLFDMLVAFNTSILDQFSANIEDPQKVNIAYAKTKDRFLLDTLSNAPIEVISFVFASDIRNQLFLFACSRLNRLLRLYRVVTIIRDWERDIRSNAFIVRLYSYLLLLALTIHCVGGCWYAFACPNGVCKDQTWTSAVDTAYFENRVHSYSILPWVDSIYWAVLTMTSTGYGDIKPQTQSEMLYASFVMVLGKIMIGYILGITAATLANDESLSVWYKQNVIAVKRCMSDHKFNKKLFNHLVQYYEYLWLKNQGVNTLNLFPDLSFSLRADIASQVCGRCVRSIRLFQDCPENFLRHVCTAMTPAAYMPGDYICFEGDVNAEMYSIYRGTAYAERFVGRERVEFYEVGEGENFLCESLLTHVRRPCSLRARTFVDVFSLTLQGLREILLYHPLVNDIIVKNAKEIYPELHF